MLKAVLKSWVLSLLLNAQDENGEIICMHIIAYSALRCVLCVGNRRVVTIGLRCTSLLRYPVESHLMTPHQHLPAPAHSGERSARTCNKL